MASVRPQKPASDCNEYRSIRLESGLRAVVVQDAEAVFAAACVNVDAGYFDDPPDLPGGLH
jgi:insulysin